MASLRHPSTRPCCLAQLSHTSGPARQRALIHRDSSVRHSRYYGPGLLEKKGANITRPRDQEKIYRYHENHGVNSLVHELVFSIDICFGSE